MQSIANQLPDVFIDNMKIMKSHIPIANTPTRVEVSIGQSIYLVANDSKPCLKHGRLVSAKDKIPGKRKIPTKKRVAAFEESVLIKQATKIVNLSKIIKQNSLENEPFEKDFSKEESPEGLSLEKDQVLENNEISTNYLSIRDIWDRNKIVADNIFSFKIAIDIIRSNDLEMEPQFVEECQCKNYWPMWLEAI